MKIASREDWTSEQYHSSNLMSRSQLRNFAQDPGEFFASGNSPKVSDSMEWGLDVEEFLFTGKLARFDKHMLIPPEVLTSDGKRRGKKWDAFHPQHPDKILLTEKDYRVQQRHRAAVEAACRRIRGTTSAADLLPGERHTCISFNKFDIEWRVQLDILHDNRIVDLKTTQDPSYESFSRSISTYWYDVQAAMYVEAVERLAGVRLPFYFIASKNTSSYNVEVYRMSDDWMTVGLRKWEHYALQYKSCLESGIWEHPTWNEVNTLYPPTWASRPWLAETI